jgi:hypothetical protein
VTTDAPSVQRHGAGAHPVTNVLSLYLDSSFDLME